MMRHGISVDLTPKPYGGNGKIEIDKENIQFEWDEDKFFLHIENPNEEDMESLEIFELNSPVPDKAFETSQSQQQRKVKSPSGIPISEWRKQFAMLPEEVVEKTLENSTHFYLSIEVENW
eukprot:10029947-Ditylum_brightwellii.AAC.1